MLFRDGRTAPGRGSSPGAMGGDAQPQIHAQFVSALVDGGVDVRTAVAAPRWYVEPRDHFVPPTDVLLEPRHAPGVAEALAALGHDLVADGAVRRQPRPRARHRAGRRRSRRADDGSVAAATDPRSAGLAGRLVGPASGPSLGRRRCAILGAGR